MKNHLLLLLCVCFMAFSCKKKETTKTGNNPVSVQNSFSLKKDGVYYSSTSINVSLADTNTISLEVYSVAGQIDNNTYAATIRRDVQPGTYSIVDGESNEFYLFHIQDPNTMFGPNNGTFTVISNDMVNKILHATFTLTMYNDEINTYPNISEGELLIHYY